MTSVSDLIGCTLIIHNNNLNTNVFCTGFNMEKQIYIGTDNNNENIIFTLKQISKIINIGKTPIENQIIMFGQEYTYIDPYKWVIMNFNRRSYENTLIETFQKENPTVI